MPRGEADRPDRVRAQDLALPQRPLARYDWIKFKNPACAAVKRKGRGRLEQVKRDDDINPPITLTP